MKYEIVKYQDAEAVVKADAFVDTSKTFENQTVLAQQYILSKEGATAIKCTLNDGSNRAKEREFRFEEGFKATFRQNYANLINWLLQSETVTKISE